MPPPQPIPFDALLAQAGWVRALARRLARDAEGAEDLAQGAFAAALERPPPAERPLGPWLARVVLNLARKENRGAARRAARERVAAQDESLPSADSLVAQFEEQQNLARLVGQMPEPYRSVVLRRYYLGESAAAIARATGVSAATVRSQLARGLERLRARLETRCHGDRGRMFEVLALASSGVDGLLSGALTTTTELIAMNTGTKIVAAAALVCVGTLGLGALLEDDGLHPDGPPALASSSSAELESDGGLAGEEESPEATRETVDATLRAPTPAAPPVAANVSAPSRTVVLARAVDGDGGAIPGAWLEVVTEVGLPREFPASAPSRVDGRVELELEEGASFQYYGAETANAHLAMCAPDRATHFLVSPVVRQGAKDIGDIALSPGGSVSGRVIDAGGAPVAYALVVGTRVTAVGAPDRTPLSGPEGERARPSVETDDGGRFELDGLSVGDARVWAHAPGSVWALSDTLTIEEGVELRGVVLTLEPTPSDAQIVGRVVDPVGVPVAGAEVLHLAPGTWDSERVTTGPDGRFQVDVTVRASHALFARDPEGRFGPAARQDASPGGEEVVFELTPLRHLIVRVVAGDGEPLETASVIAFAEYNDHLGNEYEHTDADGVVTLVAKGEPFYVTASVDGYDATRLGRFDPRDLPEEVVATLERLPMIRGRVLSGDDPVPGARVELVELHGGDDLEVHKGFPSRFFGGGDEAVVSDADGRFALATSPDFDGTYVLLAEKEAYALTELSLPGVSPVEGAEGIEIRLSAGGALEGRVLVPANRSPEGVVVAASRGDGRPRVTRTDADGRYRFDRLTPGPWRVEDRRVEPEGRVMSIARADEAPFDWNAEVVEGATTVHDLDLRWQENLRVEGRLAFDGAGAVGWSAVLEEPEHADRPWSLRPSTLDADGRFSVEALPGPATLVLRAPPGSVPAAMLKAAVVVDVERRAVEIDLSTGSLEGRMPEGATRLRVHRGIERGMHYEATFETDAEGKFALEGLPAGELEFQQYKGGAWGPGWYPVKSLVLVTGETTTFE